MSLEGGIRIRTSFPLAVQILALVGGVLVIAQLVAIGLTLLLPPPLPARYSLQDIADALKGQKVSAQGAQPLVRKLLTEPPSYRSPGWIVSPQARADLAELVGAAPDDVRLLFFFPPPAGAVTAPAQPQLKPASFTTSDGEEGPSRPEVVKVGYGTQSGPSGAFTMAAPSPGSGPVWSGLQGQGGVMVRPSGGAGFVTEPGGRWTQSGASSAPATPPLAAWRQWARRAWPGGRASSPRGAAQDLPGLSTRPSTTFPGLASLLAARGDADAATTDADPSPGQTAAQGPSAGADARIYGAFEAASPQAPAASPHRKRSALESSGLLAPAPLLALKTGDGSGWVVGSTPPGAPAARPMSFVPGDFVAALRLGSSSWATVQPLPETFPNRWQKRVFLWFATAMLLMAPLVWLFARRLTGPLAAFAAAAEQLGRDPAASPANLTGPAEVGRAARAFNEMQARLKRFVDDRTAMVGAISHDLRTPLARMRFRLERAPPEVRKGMLRDIQQMEEMLNSVLVFIRDASEPAARTRVDLRSIIECAVEDAEMVGGEVVLKPGPPVSVEVDPLAIRRVAANLIDNALKYGGSAELSLFTDGREVTVAVADEGPGLDGEELERVFAPFYRSDAARSMNQGGIGLGLPVSRSIARSHGGDVRLANRPGGLLAELTLPLAPSQSAPAAPYLRPFFPTGDGAREQAAQAGIDEP